MPGGAAAGLTQELIWHDDDHLRVGNTNFLLALDWDIADKTESTIEQFLLVKNRWLLETTLEHLPDSVRNMVEFGIFKGGSIALYETLLSPERFVGVDIKSDRVKALDEYLDRHHAADRVRLYYGTDQNDRQALKSIARENFGNGDRPLDLVIDDGSHRYEPSKTSLNVFLPLVRSGGVYIIEDWAWAHWQGPYHQENAAFGQYADQPSPLTKLVFEAVMLAASRPYIISDIYIDATRAFLIRGREDITNRDFDISTSYLTSLWRMKFPMSMRDLIKTRFASLRTQGGNAEVLDLWKKWAPHSIGRRVRDS